MCRIKLTLFSAQHSMILKGLEGGSLESTKLQALRQSAKTNAVQDKGEDEEEED